MERLTKNNKELNCCCGKPIPKECININCSETMQCSGLINVIEKLAEYENTGLEPKEIEQLKSELEKLKKNAIVPKFKIGQEVWILLEGEAKIFKVRITKFEYYGNESLNPFRYECIIPCERIFTIRENLVFNLEQEAEEALRKLEEV